MTQEEFRDRALKVIAARYRHIPADSSDTGIRLKADIPSTACIMIDGLGPGSYTMEAAWRCGGCEDRWHVTYNDHGGVWMFHNLTQGTGFGSMVDRDLRHFLMLEADREPVSVNVTVPLENTHRDHPSLRWSPVSVPCTCGYEEQNHG